MIEKAQALINQYDEIKLEELINKNLDEIIYN